MKKVSSILAATALIVLGSNVNASETGELAVGIKAGTLGTGIEVNYPVSPRLTVTAGINTFSQSMTDTTDGIDYDVDFNLQTIALLANFHPFAGSFRITGGIMINNNELKMSADPSVTYDLGDLGNSYALTSLDAKVNFNKMAPYAGIGIGHSASNGFGFNLDIGVLMQGKPQVDFSVKGAPAVINDPTFQADLAREESNAEDDIKGFTMYPVISAGINYRF